METIQKATENLIHAIKTSDIYTRYLKCEAALDKFPGMFERIAELRKATIAAYHDPDNKDLLALSDLLGRQYGEIQKIPEVNAYLEAEEELMRALQNIDSGIISALNLRVPNI